MMVWDPLRGEWVDERDDTYAPSPNTGDVPPGQARVFGSGGDSPYSAGDEGGLTRYPGPFRPNYSFGAAPSFEFRRPTGADVEADPSFDFRRGLGQKGIEQSAAARGLLRTGGTLKDILGFNQNFASQEYSNVYDRMFREAQENYRPRFNEWMFLQQANQRAADLEWQRFWDEWTYNNPSATTIYNAGQDGPPDVGRR